MIISHPNAVLMPIILAEFKPRLKITINHFSDARTEPFNQYLSIFKIINSET